VTPYSVPAGYIRKRDAIERGICRLTLCSPLAAQLLSRRGPLFLVVGYDDAQWDLVLELDDEVDDVVSTDEDEPVRSAFRFSLDDGLAS
jgi:hypothetical protein